MLTFGQEPESRPLTSLLPYRTESGPVVLGARALTSSSYALSWSPARGEWRGFGTLELSGEIAEDEHVSFDPVLNQLPGLEQYPVVVRLRSPAYRQARKSRQPGVSRPTA